MSLGVIEQHKNIKFIFSTDSNHLKISVVLDDEYSYEQVAEVIKNIPLPNSAEISNPERILWWDYDFTINHPRWFNFGDDGYSKNGTSTEHSRYRGKCC